MDRCSVGDAESQASDDGGVSHVIGGSNVPSNNVCGHNTYGDVCSHRVCGSDIWDSRIRSNIWDSNIRKSNVHGHTSASSHWRSLLKEP